MPDPGEKILVLDRGNVEFAFPGNWTVEPDAEGFLKLKDPEDKCVLEVSYLRLPPLSQNAPSVEELLVHVVRDAPGASSAIPVTVERGQVRIAWAAYEYEAEDTKGGPTRPARARWLLARNQLFQVLMTFYFWPEDEAWAVVAWERFGESLQLGDGVPLRDPNQHWAVRGLPN